MSIKSVAVFFGVLALIFSPVILSHIVWRFAPVLSLSMKAADYSVPDETYRNHKGLFWLLNHLRIPAPAPGGPWVVERDYIGFDPKGEGRGTTVAQTSLEDTAWIYLADTYGVHETDRKPRTGQKTADGFIFGGLTMDDAKALSSFANRGGGIISEFNSLSDPTPRPVQEAMSNLMGISHLGWAGRFVSDLRKLPSAHRWFTDLYKKNYGKHPLPEGPGMMLIGENEKLVILGGARFEESMPSLSMTDKGRIWIDRPVGTPPYYGWFGAVEARPGTEVLAEMQLPTPLDWRAVLAARGIPSRFPSLLRRSVGKSERIYIAADISLLEEAPNFYGLAFLPRILAAINRRRDSRRYGPTFWQFFVPVVSKILTDAASTGAVSQKGATR